MIGLSDFLEKGEHHGPRLDGHTTWLATSNGNQVSNDTKMTVADPDFDATPSRRALHNFHSMVTSKIHDTSNQYVPYLK
jgi:hypothetical protein